MARHVNYSPVLLYGRRLFDDIHVGDGRRHLHRIRLRFYAVRRPQRRKIFPFFQHHGRYGPSSVRAVRDRIQGNSSCEFIFRSDVFGSRFKRFSDELKLIRCIFYQFCQSSRGKLI